MMLRTCGWRAYLRAALLLITAALLSTVTHAQDSFVAGVALSWRDPPRVIAQAEALGARSVRVDAPWEQIESADGSYSLPSWLQRLVDEAQAKRIDVLLILDYGHPRYGGDKPQNQAQREAFGRYAAWLVRTLKGKVKYFQLWNEWEAKTGGTTPGTAKEYAELARVVMPMVRAENSNAIFLSNGSSYPALTTAWLDELLAAKVLHLFDGFAVHPYVFFRRSDWSPEAAIRLIDKVHQRVVAAGYDIPFYVTEFGFPDYAGPQGVAAESVAAFLTRFFLMAEARPWIRGIWWYCLRDQGMHPSEREHSFGLLDANFGEKPASAAFQRVAGFVHAGKRGQLRVQGAEYEWQSADGGRRLTWTEDPTGLATGSRRRPANAPKREN